MKKVIVIVGPTASGKTELSITLAKKIDSEIISADSRQFYKFLDIGTAKPSGKELSEVKHHFINSLLPDEEYNASRFEKESLEIINELIRKGKTPVVAGGSGLYIKALADGVFDTADKDPEYRNRLFEKRKKFGNEYLYDELKKVDPESASKMLPQNWKRIIRALEVYHLAGKPIGILQDEYRRETDFNFIQYGLSWDRKQLYENIENRVDKMIDGGLLDEVKNILDKGYSKDLNSLNTVGYKEMISYLNDEISFERAVELIKRNSRRYAKRQMTWFKGDERIKWFEIKERDELQNISDVIIKENNL